MNWRSKHGVIAAAATVLVLCVAGSAELALAVDATWVTDAVGNWSDGANWSTNPAVPDNTGYTVFFGSGQATIDDEFTIGHLNWTGGGLVRSATPVGDSALTVDLGTTISGPATKHFATTTLNLNGPTTWSGGSIDTVETVENPEGGVVNIGGAFDIQFDGTWSWNATATPTINVAAAASIVKSAGDEAAVLYPEVNSDGLVDVQSGTLHLAGGGGSNGTFTVANEAILQFSDFNQDYSAAGAETTTLGVDSVVNAGTGGTVRFTNLFGSSRTDVYGTINATVVEADPGEFGLVLFHQGSSLGATTRGSYTANSGGSAFDAISAKVIDVIVNDGAVMELGNGATLNVSGAVNVNEGGVLNAGSLATAGSIFLDDALQQQLITGSGEIVLANSSCSITAAFRVLIDSDVTIRGSGRIIGKTSSPTNGSNLGTVLSDVTGGTLRTDFLNNTFSIQGTGGGSVDYRDGTNLGTISVAGGGNLLTTNLVNSGIVTINGGTLELNGNNWDNTAGAGVINATNASIVMRGDLTFANVGAITRTNTELFLQGTLQNTAQTLNLDNSTGERGSWVMNSGTSARIVGGTVQTSGGARLVFRGSSAGTLEGVTLKSAPLFENGTTIFVASGLTLDNVTLDLSNGGTGAATITFIEAGSRFINGTGQIVFGNADNRGIDNQVGNVQATIGPNILIRGQLGRLAGGGAGILLQGSVSADVSGGQISLDNVTIAAGGVGEAKNGGRLLLQGNWDNDGTLRVLNGSTLDLFGTFDTPDVGVVQRTGTTTVQMFGVLTNTSQTFDIHTSTGSLVLRSGATIVGGRVQSSGASALTVSLDGVGSTLNGVTLATNVSFASGAGGLVNVVNNLTLDNATIDMATGGTGRVLSFGGGTGTRTLGGTGDVVLGLSSTVRNAMTAGGVLVVGSGVTVRGEGTLEGVASSGGVVNQGTVRAEGAGASLTLRRATNAGGLIRATASNTIRITLPSVGETTFVQTAGELSAAATGAIQPDRGVDIRGGKLSGGGTVQILNDAAPNSFVRATNGGAIAPGDSIGTLTVDGNVIIGDGGHLAIELSGATTDLLSIVKGQFQPAAGNLDLSSENDFLDVTKLGPLTATSYVIATYVGALSGTFDHVTAGYSVTYDTALKRVLLIAPPRADFDLDNDVDGNDFLVWQRGLGILTGATRVQGDANGDGAVNAADLALWRSQFGTPGATAASASVPEPGGAMLALAALGSAAMGVRRRRAAEFALMIG